MEEEEESYSNYMNWDASGNWDKELLQSEFGCNVYMHFHTQSIANTESFL